MIRPLDIFIRFLFQVRESYFEEVISKLDFNDLSNSSFDADLSGTHQHCKDMFIYSIVSMECKRDGFFVP
jgi:hypothetical protein